ncbi:CaiB/BaiF CoA transferase family protein [Gordonia humi]|nr:CoA transferase [Gordonia humi]
MDGIRVVEVAAWTYVPVAGAILAEWGADVLKIEHPESGDPQRGLVTSGLIPEGAVNHMFELPNRGKRSVALDLKSKDGHDLLMKLIATADVFLTNFRPEARKKLGLDVDDLRAVNDKIIYVRGSSVGQRGDEANRGGYDMTSFWSRSGAADNVTPDSSSHPLTMPGPAFGDSIGGLTIAGAISTALLHRERTGEALTVDSSLLAMGAWSMGATIAGAHAFAMDRYPKTVQSNAANPLVNIYKTADDRFISLVMLESDRYWPGLVTALGIPEAVNDPRFVSHATRSEHRLDVIKVLDDAFGNRTLAEIKEAFADVDGSWCVVQTPREVVSDPQVVANGYIADLTDANSVDFKLVSAPVQFNETPSELSRAPMHGEHTDAVLEEIGLTMDEIIEYKINGAVL